MESSDAEMGMADCGVGTIVWVRRRNGSWWPGKILGPVELSASHLMSPRSGTPVKLLGREDASVDWYNLEKSKRVKPFRCGEFDDCIERAEASQGMPPKKREKYARREDAILHALELEKQLLEKKSNNAKLIGNDTETSCDPSSDLLFSAQVNADDKTRPSRLRGLQQEAKHNLSSLADGLTTENSCKNVLEKRKRLQQEEETTSKRRRPLVQVLNSSAKLIYPYADREEQTDTNTQTLAEPTNFEENHVGGLSNATGSNEDTETDSSGTQSLLSDTFDSMAALLDEGENIEFIPKAAAAFEGQGEDDASTSDESGGSGDSLPIQKWQLKGKRNTRISSSSSRLKDEILVHFREPPVHVSRMLIDVEVGVQSGYQREHVPMISLMSKLNDQAIVGHPIPVETLEENASSDFIIYFPSPDYEESCLQPWRTARRTAKYRVHRPPHVEEDQEEYFVENDKSKKHRTSSCNQKIRTLSSISGNHHRESCAGEEGGIMKPEPLPTAVACIPVKLVFSRLHEELVARHQ